MHLSLAAARQRSAFSVHLKARQCSCSRKGRLTGLNAPGLTQHGLARRCWLRNRSPHCSSQTSSAQHATLLLSHSGQRAHRKQSCALPPLCLVVDGRVSEPCAARLLGASDGTDLRQVRAPSLTHSLTHTLHTGMCCNAGQLCPSHSPPSLPPPLSSASVEPCSSAFSLWRMSVTPPYLHRSAGKAEQPAALADC